MNHPKEKIEDFLREVAQLSKKHDMSFHGSVFSECWTEETRIYWDDEKNKYFYKYNVGPKDSSDEGFEEVK